jgi:hypothetical protein
MKGVSQLSKIEGIVTSVIAIIVIALCAGIYFVIKEVKESGGIKASIVNMGKDVVDIKDKIVE